MDLFMTVHCLCLFCHNKNFPLIIFLIFPEAKHLKVLHISGKSWVLDYSEMDSFIALWFYTFEA